jgi:Tfp pilus assembly protein PilF/peroxiredoxin
LRVETWLIQPLKAPEFSLPDIEGKMRDLQSFQGKCVLVNFWASSAPQSLELLEHLSQRETSASSDDFVILAVNVDTADRVGTARSFASQKQFRLQVLFANEEVGGIYNILYRYMFDRRRDLPIPISFLLDKEGMIVKVYQGSVDLVRLREDAMSIPANENERMDRALPFKGLLVQDAFQRNDFTYGAAMYQHGYFDQAVESFRQVLASKPDNADAYYNLGTLHLKKNEFEQARKYLERTLQFQPKYPEAWNNLGMMAAQQGQLDEAIHDFEQALQLRPGYAVALLNLGNLYRRQRNFEKSHECLGRALTLQPDDPEINYSLGMLYAQQDQMQRASDYLQKALELRPQFPEALNNLGVLFVREQEYTKAEDQFKTGIRVAPKFDQSYLNLARLYVMRNEKEQARRVLLELLSVQPENTTAKQALEMLQ